MRYSLRYISILLALATCLVGKGQEGTSSFDFLNIPTSTHAYALGGTNISVIDEDVNLINQNPALLGPESDLQLGLNYMKYVGGINLAGATFAKAAGERAEAFAQKHAGATARMMDEMESLWQTALKNRNELQTY